MFRLERELAERMYRRANGARAIVATPTLAQGLNLPAELAILAGDKRSDPDGLGRDDLAAHELLNAAARAGRAGHVSNGIVLLIPEPYVVVDRLDRLEPQARKKLEAILPEDDRCVDIYDPLGIVLDRISTGESVDGDSAYVINRLLATRSSQAEEDAPLFDLNRSLGRFAAVRDDAGREFDEKLAGFTSEMLRVIPEGLTHEIAFEATQTGLSISVIQGLHQRIASEVGELPTSVSDWIVWAFEWFKSDDTVADSFFGAVASPLNGACGLARDGEITDAAFDGILSGVLAWVAGRTIRDIEVALGGELAKADGTATTCPRARDLVNSVIPRGLSYALGVIGSVALKQEVQLKQTSVSIDVLECLGAATRLGYDRPQKLRFMQRHRQYLSRVSVHAAFRQAEFDF